MKKTNPIRADDMRIEYDFASMKGGVRGKDASRARAGMNIVLIEPEVAEAFPSEQAVRIAQSQIAKAFTRATQARK